MKPRAHIFDSKRIIILSPRLISVPVHICMYQIKNQSFLCLIYITTYIQCDTHSIHGTYHWNTSFIFYSILFPKSMKTSIANTDTVKLIKYKNNVPSSLTFAKLHDETYETSSVNRSRSQPWCLWHSDGTEKIHHTDDGEKHQTNPKETAEEHQDIAATPFKPVESEMFKLAFRILAEMVCGAAHLDNQTFTF